jgi:transcriptional regulator with XRE-family HTH domain
MIKNEAQLARVTARIRQLTEELRQAGDTKQTPIRGLTLSSLNAELARLQLEVDEYHQLRSLPTHSAIQAIAMRPHRLEEVGELMSKLRIASKLTQAQMAATLGWRQPNLARFESPNYASQTIAKVSEYAGALGLWLHIYPSTSEEPPKVAFQVTREGQFPVLVDLLSTESVTEGQPRQTTTDFGTLRSSNASTTSVRSNPQLNVAQT